MKFNFHNKIHLTAIVFVLAINLFFILGLPNKTLAAFCASGAIVGEDGLPCTSGPGGTAADINAAKAQVAYMECYAKCPATPVPTGPYYTCMYLCMSDAQIKNSSLQMDNDWKIRFDQVTVKAKETSWTTALALAFKSSLSLMSKTLAKDTATWVASGGKGQKPLFITEGWTKYLENIGNSALGDFVDQVGQRYGVDLCKGDISALIKISIAQPEFRRVRCTFTQMMTNWQTAVTNPNFAFEYNNSLNPGENDISAFLKLSGESMVAVSNKKEMGKLAVSPDGWKSVTDFVGKVLTPGDAVQKWVLGKSIDQSTMAEQIWTGTLADFLNTFAQTLIGQLLQNFKNGLFTSGSNSNKNSLSGLALPDISSLLNPQAQPYNEGAEGAEARFNQLKQSEYSVVGSYDILTKLMTCPDDSKNNPGPTDCVLDQSFGSYIKSKKQVWKVSDDSDANERFLNRPFVAGDSSSNNYTTEINYRMVLILRKYRIVPIGWEIAANYVKNSQDQVRLVDIMDQFNNKDSKYYGLIDPYWVFKAPEVYCRRQGYGDHNTSQNEQDGSISRDQYCADEQQCIKENANGSCSAYGYCTEERRFWNFGTACDSKYNTCQTFSSRLGETQSYLGNTLDYRDCNAGNAGCRWYSNLLDPVTNNWRSLAPDAVARACASTDGCLVTTTNSTIISQYHQISDTGDASAIVKMATPCSASSCTGQNHCTYDTTTKACNFGVAGVATCTIPFLASTCDLENCLDTTDVLSSFNGSFEDAGSTSFVPKSWVEDLSSMNSYTRDYRAPGKGVTSSAALAVIANIAPNAPNAPDASSSEIFSLKDITPLARTSTYQLKFSARADSIVGDIDVQFYLGSNLAQSFSINGGNTDAGWKDHYMYIDSGNYTTATIKIITRAGTTATAYFDNFELKKLIKDCQENSVSLSLPAINGGFAYDLALKTSSDIYFNRNAQICDGANAGCSQFIRTKSGLGSNLINNGSFEDAGFANWDNSCAIMDSANFKSGKYSLKLANNCSTTNNTVDSTGINLLFGHKYILSAWVYAVGSYSVALGVESNSGYTQSSVSLSTEANTWKQVQVALPSAGTDFPSGGVDGLKVKLISSGAGPVYFDDVKLEEVPYNVDSPSAYSDYMPSARPASQLAYLKLAPDYYNCYKSTSSHLWANDGNIYDILKNRNSSCSKYAPVCTASEVGCELYKPLSGDPNVPGVAETLDACPQECVGYQVYKKEGTDFVSSSYSQFIADNVPKYCSANDAGCDEFTNLDNVGSGAENREYYVHLNVCEKPGANENTYYTWEGDDTAGYQLKVFKLKKSNATSTNPINSANYYKPCTDLFYSTDQATLGQPLCYDKADKADGTDNGDKGFCTKDDMVVNPDCREFYDADGNISHRLLSKTITISSNCHPYRRTMTQLSFTDAGLDCQSHNGFWNGNNECIYMAIPGEGQLCSVASKGCREYTGNTGNNVRNILNSNFDTATTSQDWKWGYNSDGSYNAEASTSNDSTFVGGRSLTNNGVSETSTLRHLVNISPNKAYVLSFWAKSDGPRLSYIKFDSAKKASDFFAVSNVSDSDINSVRPALSKEWRRYEVGPVFVNWSLPSADNYLEFSVPAGVRVYLNNIILKEIQNSVYLVENSWYTPFSCDNNLGDDNGQSAYTASQTVIPPKAPEEVCSDQTPAVDSHRCLPGNMLGCSSYRDRAGNIAYLRSFARICRLEAVGCERLIDTHNYNSPNGNTWNSDSPTSTISVPAHNAVYLVTDSGTACPATQMGCTAYGLPNINKYDEVIGYNDIYLKNLPERYDTDLCKFNELWCDEYAGGNSFSYFKNPHGKVCEYIKSASSSQTWIKQGTDEFCTTTLNQTFGTGYENTDSKVQPLGVVDNVTGADRTTSYNGWVGLCPALQSGCAEYVDPLDKIYTAEINNPSPDSPIKLDYNTLYTISFGNAISSVGIGCPQNEVLLISPDNSLVRVPNEVRYSYPHGLHSTNTSVARFYLTPLVATTSKSVTCTFFAGNVSGKTGFDYTKISKAGVYYKISGTVDSGNCNGKVDFKTGCVLFNDRSQIDYSILTTSTDPNSSSTKDRFLKNLIFDAQATYLENMPTSAISLSVSPQSSANNSANIIVSAGADRVCSNWLTCNTYQKPQNSSQFNFTDNDKCLGISGCSSFDDNGNCNKLENIPNGQNSIDKTKSYDSEVDKNRTGYVMTDSKVNTTTEGNLKGIINNPYEDMRQLGGTSGVVNGDFEMVFGKSSEPIGWAPGYLACQVIPSSPCDALEPKMSGVVWNSDQFKVVYNSKQAESGSSYLQLNAGNVAVSESIAVETSTPYYLSFWVNTTNLIGSGSSTPPALPYAEARFIYLDDLGRVRDASSKSWKSISPGVSWDGLIWETSTALITSKGVNWKHVIYEIRPPASSTSLKIALFNANPDKSADGENGFDQTKLGGYSMWDNIGVNTVLDTNGTSTGQLARTCRIYPASDAPGCRYNKDSTQYFGQYGYCLLKDPAPGSQQCLQWWPVDTIAGESIDDYSAFYQERMPLYYCLGKANSKFDFSNITINVNAANLGDSSAGMQLVESHSGNEVKFFPFSNVPASMRTLLRYPYVYRFSYVGAYIGYGTQVGMIIPLPLIAFMKPYEVFGWGGDLPFYYANLGQRTNAGLPTSTNPLANEACPNGIIGCGMCEDHFRDKTIPDPNAFGIYCDPRENFIDNDSTDSTRGNKKCNPNGSGYKECFPISSGSCGNANGSDVGMGYVNLINSGMDWQKFIVQVAPLASGQSINTIDAGLGGMTGFQKEPRLDDLYDDTSIEQQCKDGTIDPNTGLLANCTAEQKLATCLWLFGANDLGARNISARRYDEASGLLRVGQSWLKGGIIDTVWQWGVSIYDLIKNGIISATTLNQDDYWGGWGVVGVYIPGIPIPIAFTLPAHTVSQIKGIGGTITSFISNLNGKGLNNPSFGWVTFKIVTDEDTNYGSAVGDPHPNVKGDIVGYAMGQSGAGSTDKANGSGVIGGVSSDGFSVDYCTRVVQVVDSSGQQKAYTARTSPGSSFKTSSTLDWDCVTNGLYGNAWENELGLKTFTNWIKTRLVTDCTGAGCDKGGTKATTTANRCFDHSAYCTREGLDLTTAALPLANRLSAPYNYCGNYVGDHPVASTTERLGLLCDTTGASFQDSSLGNFTFYSVYDDVDNNGLKKIGISPNPNYFCILGGGPLINKWRIYSNIYHYTGYNYRTDVAPYASLVAPITSQYPSEWDSKDDVPYMQPLLYEANGDTSGIGQARMGQVHNKGELQQLFAKSYGVWDWLPDVNSTGEIKGRYIPTSGYDWSIPTTACADGKRGEGVLCYNLPVIVNSPTHPTTTNIENGHTILANSPLRLDFNVQVDPEQLPIRSYSVEWGDGLKTSFSGTALLDKTDTSNPFTLYHFYGDTTATDITIRVKDNWDKEGVMNFNVANQGLSCGAGSTCDPATNSCCKFNSNSTCTFIPDGSFTTDGSCRKCDSGGNASVPAPTCGADETLVACKCVKNACVGAGWSCADGTPSDTVPSVISSSGCTKQQSIPHTCILVGGLNPDGITPNPDCDIARGPDPSATTTQWVSNDTLDNGVCCSAPEHGVSFSENWTNEKGCPLKEDDIFTMTIDKTGTPAGDNPFITVYKVGSEDNSLNYSRSGAGEKFKIGRVSPTGASIKNGDLIIFTCQNGKEVKYTGWDVWGGYWLNCNGDGDRVEVKILKVSVAGESAGNEIHKGDDVNFHDDVGGHYMVGSNNSTLQYLSPGSAYGFHICNSGGDCTPPTLPTALNTLNSAKGRVAGATEQKQLNMIDKIEIAVGNWVNGLWKIFDRK